MCVSRDGKRPELWRPARDGPNPSPRSKKERPHATDLAVGSFASVFVVFRRPARAFDPVVASTCDGEALLPERRRRGADGSKSVYGLLDDPSATRDVTQTFRRCSPKRFSFPVTDMAKGDDPHLCT
jgi:hypothetical protein